MMAAPPEMNGNIRKFEEIGTHPAANHNAIAEALTFHQGIGAERKAARLRYLRDRWAKRLEQVPGVKILTPVRSEAVVRAGVVHAGDARRGQARRGTCGTSTASS